MSGFPSRPALADFGPITLVNARPVRDTTKELDVTHWLLSKFQVAGMGLVSPRVIAKVSVDASPALSAHAEAWNPEGQTSGAYAAPTPAAVATGRITLEYQTPVPDLLGEDIAINFLWAFAFVHQDPPTTFRMAMACPLNATPHILSISVFDAAGALQNGSDVWVFAG